MKKIVIVLFLCFPLLAKAGGEKTWSVYGNVGYGTSSVVTLDGLSMSAEDAEFFNKRGLTPSFKTEGNALYTPEFNVGVSRYFGRFRVSGQIGSHYVNQSNYHATNFTADALVGYNFLKGNHELVAEIGVGSYNCFNDYIYNWVGYEDDSMTTVLETRSVNLGNHDVHSLSIPVRASYAYNIVGHHWLGVYAQGRYNFASDAFCPTEVFAVGIECRYIWGKAREKKNKVQTIFVDRYVTVRDTVYVEKVVRDTTFVPTPMAPFKAVVNFEFDSYELTEASKASLDAFIKQIDGEDVRVIVMGYTDGIGTFGYNLNLSYFRSAEIFGYLNHNGIPASNISYGGASFTQPIAPNTNGEDRAKNRRVEIYAVYR